MYRRPRALTDLIQDDLNGVYADYYRKLRDGVVDFAHYESDWTARSLKSAVGVDFDLPTRAQLRNAVLSTPLVSLQGPNRATLLRGFFHTVVNWFRLNLYYREVRNAGLLSRIGQLL